MSSPAAYTAAGTTPVSASGTAGPADTGTLPPAKVVIHAQTFNSDCGWPVELKLDSTKGNWPEWDKQLRFLCDQRGFWLYLNGTLA